MREAGQHVIFEVDVPGVRPADQKRSRVLQDKFVAVGREVLLTKRLKDLSVPALAREAKSSVGGFYSRFENKEAFFEFLRMQMLAEHMKFFDERLAPEHFVDAGPRQVSEAFVDAMLSVFAGPWRGVLREAYSMIPDNPERWRPMYERGRILRERIKLLYGPLIKDREGFEERVSFAVQMLFSALNNEMMNPNLAFRIDDPQFREYLVLAFDKVVTG